MTQSPLFPPAHAAPPLPPFVRHSETSRQAAIAMYPKQGTQRRTVYDFIASCGSYGCTDEEGQEALGMPNAYRARRGELAGDRGHTPVLIKDSGRTRTTRAGLQAVVWVDASSATTPQELEKEGTQ